MWFELKMIVGWKRQSDENIWMRWTKEGDERERERELKMVFIMKNEL